MWKDRAPGHLDNVVESLAGVVPQATVSIIETRQHRLDQLLQVQPRILGAPGDCLAKDHATDRGKGWCCPGTANTQACDGFSAPMLGRVD